MDRSLNDKPNTKVEQSQTGPNAASLYGQEFIGNLSKQPNNVRIVPVEKAKSPAALGRNGLLADPDDIDAEVDAPKVQSKFSLLLIPIRPRPIQRLP